MNSLTTEQIARVFAMYIGQQVNGVAYSSELFTGKLTISFLYRMSHPKYSEIKLILRPLSAITDEVAIEVAKIAGIGSMYAAEYPARMGRELIESYLNSSRCNVRGSDWMQLHQLLTQRGYALPLFIAPNHPDNNKTALDLGLAITQ